MEMNETERIIITSILNEYRAKYYVLTDIFMQEINDEIRMCGINYQVEECHFRQPGGYLQLTQPQSN